MIFREKLDVVLLDVGMPGLSGDQLAKLIVRRFQRTHVVLHSTLTDEALADLVIKSGAIGAIHKTDDTGDFMRSFGRLVGEARRASGG